MITFSKILMAVSISSIVLLACSKNEVAPDPTAGLHKVGGGYAIGAAAKIELFTTSGSVTAGYQPFKIAVYDSITGKAIHQAQISLQPMMNMGTMKHAAPFENPASNSATHQLFNAAVFFTMPGSGSSWTIEVNIHNLSNGQSGKISIPVEVAEPAKKRMLSFKSAIDNSTTYFVGLVEPASRKVGINPLELVVYKKQNMMLFPADSSLSISFVPEMPAMSHGSPNNVQPIHTGVGHYQGKVNFTMTGLWRLHFHFQQGDAVAKTDSLDIEF